MNIQRVEIANGVFVNYIPERKFKTNYLSFQFVDNIQADTAYEHALIPAVLARGCERYPDQMKLNRKMQYLYSVDMATCDDLFGEYQVFGFKVNCLHNRFTEGLDVEGETVDLLCQILFHPYLEDGVFSASYLETEKSNLIDVIRSEINNKSRYAMRRTVEILCKDEPFALSKYGTEEQVQSATSRKLYQAYLRVLKTCPVEIYLVGDFQFDSVCARFQNEFACLKREVKPLSEFCGPLTSNGLKEVSESQNITQGKLCLGFRTGKKPNGEDYCATQLFSEVLGGSPTSKLFMNVREKMSLCYYCRSVVSQRNPIMMISSGIEFENKDVAKDAILQQLADMQNGSISEEELESAKKSLRNGYLSIYDDAGAMATYTMYRHLNHNFRTPQEESEAMERLCKEDIVKIAKKMQLDTVFFLKGEEK